MQSQVANAPTLVVIAGACEESTSREGWDRNPRLIGVESIDLDVVNERMRSIWNAGCTSHPAISVIALRATRLRLSIPAREEPTECCLDS